MTENQPTAPDIQQPEPLRVQLFEKGDESSHNTISLPFKDIIRDSVYLVPSTPGEARASHFGKSYDVRVVEACVGMWLSRLTHYLVGDASAAYDDTFIGLVDQSLADGLVKHAALNSTTQPDFPNVYKRGDVPADYDDAAYDPDDIYPGQRFLMVRAAETVTFDENLVFEAVDPGFWDEVWVAVIWGGQGDLGIGGAHTAYGAVVSVGDLVKYRELRRFSGLSVHGWRVGLGVGASSGAAVIIFANYPTVESLNGYANDGFEWDIALGAKVPKGATKYVKAIYEALRGLKGVKRFAKTGKKGEAVKTAVETIIKGLKGGIPNDGVPFRIGLPVPFTGPGLHIWGGFKTTQFETFLATTFGEEKQS